MAAAVGDLPVTELRRPRYTRRDANQQEIVDDLRGLGFYVLDLADVGGEAPDIFVCGHIGGDWHWLAVEIKTPGGRLTDTQKRIIDTWPDMPALMAQATEDVLAWYNWAGNRNIEYEEVKG